MGEITLTIDGIQLPAEEGMTVLDAALANDYYIPHLCHHPDLVPTGRCRLCGVEINGRMVMSCLTPAQDGMVISTESPELNRTRRMTAELIISNHKADCLSCPMDTHCELQRIAAYVGIEQERLDRMRQPVFDAPIDDSNPFFVLDPNKCVLCGICVRTCEELRLVSAIDLGYRGYHTVISTFGNRPRVESNCESCGACVARCPVGALYPVDFRLPARQVQTTCVYCGVGCGIYLGVRGDQVVGVLADRERSTNKGQLCVKGRFGYKFINHPDRLKTPLIRRDGELEEATWDEALDLVASKFAHSMGDRFATLASAKCTNEDNFVIQKFARAVMGTNNIDHCARL